MIEAKSAMTLELNENCEMFCLKSSDKFSFKQIFQEFRV